MNVLLWGLQIALALKFVSVTISHGLRPDETEMERGRQRLGVFARPLLILIAVGAFVGGVGVVVPAATGFRPELTGWSAVLLAVMAVFSGGFHIACRESPRIWVSGILCVLAAFVAYGRWVTAPF